MPYMWSLNNVVMAEVAHTSLGYWQANRPDAAFSLFKGCLLDSMFLGTCPGNVGMSSAFDMARGEAQRDFGDAIGICSRTMIEGLFGVHPDVLAGELRIRPGFPAAWDDAKLHHPDFNFEFRRDDLKETYRIESSFSRPMRLRLQVPALRTRVRSVLVDGRSADWRVLEGEVGLLARGNCDRRGGGPQDHHHVEGAGAGGGSRAGDHGERRGISGAVRRGESARSQ